MVTTFTELKQAVTVLLCLSYAVGVPTTSSLPIARRSTGTMASSNQNLGYKQLLTIRDTIAQNAHQAKSFYQTTFAEPSKHPDVNDYKKYRIDFFFKHTLEQFNFPENPTFEVSELERSGATVKEFTKYFYDCFLRYNATMDKIGQDNKVRNKLKVLLVEMKEYIVVENIEPLKEKYEMSDVDLKEYENRDNISSADIWLRDMIIYRDFAITLDYVLKAYEHFCNLENEGTSL